ncbi:VOC family protein [Neiella marina]|uniref:VOC family protein n=1 Tax=Neiella holothuriorum TaxID=2870530 RepID=A0ABS7EID0_9GAMM|nr:VOC family protein [Neiella holothuriorum]MBW8191975.1 VOC family protein [Neiella holothuriorum]
MHLGVFSISLSVKDLAKSKAFYQTIGFDVFAGDEAHNYLIMKNGDTLIGLFQGMFDNNMLTFNPGRDANAQELAEFTDVQAIYQHAVANGLEVKNENLPEGNEQQTTGPGHFMLMDPDGNAILIDQHRAS